MTTWAMRSRSCRATPMRRRKKRRRNGQGSECMARSSGAVAMTKALRARPGVAMGAVAGKAAETLAGEAEALHAAVAAALAEEAEEEEGLEEEEEDEAVAVAVVEGASGEAEEEAGGAGNSQTSSTYTFARRRGRKGGDEA